ncbi:hypothetical protein ES703_59906 [subsurface metagenome]
MIWPAILLECLDVSKRVIRLIPLLPLERASQLFSVPTPKGETRPIPVITTRLSLGFWREEGEFPIRNFEVSYLER